MSINASLLAATRTASVTGNWSSTTTWGGAAVPAANDVVIINAGVTVTVNTNTNLVKSVTVNGTLVLSGASSLRLATTGTGNFLTVNSGGQIQFNSTGLVTGGGSNTAGLVVTINSGATLSSKNTIGFMAQTAATNTTNTGCFSINRGTSTSPVYNAGVNYIFNHSTNQNTGTGVVATANLTISNTGGQVTASAGITASGTVTISTGANFNLAATTLNLTATGTPFTGAGTFTAGTSTVNYSRAGTQTLRAGTYNNLTLSGSSAKTIASGTTVNGTLLLSGTASGAGNTPTYGGSAILEYRGSAAQVTGTELPASGFGGAGIVINNTDGVSMAGTKNLGAKPITIGNTVANSILKDSSFQITCTGNLNLVSGTFRLGSAAAATTYPAFASSSLAAGTTIQYASGAGQTVSTSPSYKNLVFSGNGNKTTAAGTLTIAENWTLTGGTAALNTNSTSAGVLGDILGSATMTLGSGTLSITGDFTHTGSFNAGTSTVNYNNLTGGQTVKSAVYNILTLSNTSGTQTAAIGTITATTLNTSAGGSFDMGTNILSVTNVNHAGTLITQNTSSTPITANKTWGGTVSYNSTSPQTIAYGNYNNLIGTGGNRTLSTAGPIGIAGTFTPGSGTYTVPNSTVNFNGGGNQNLPAFTFHDLVISNAGIKKIPASIVVACQTIDIMGAASVEIDATNAGRLNVLE
jgi:hypothetical protein